MAGAAALPVTGCLSGAFNASGSGGSAGTTGTGGATGTVSATSSGTTTTHASTSGTTATSTSTTTSSSSGSGCAAPKSICNGDCVDKTTNPNHCGDCNTVCSPSQECLASACKCRPAFTECDGGCVDVQHDPQNCGGCGMACTTDAPDCSPTMIGSAGPTCVQACVAPYMLKACNGGCYTAFNTQLDCGACGKACTNTQTCAPGTVTAGAMCE